MTIKLRIFAALFLLLEYLLNLLGVGCVIVFAASEWNNLPTRHQAPSSAAFFFLFPTSVKVSSQQMKVFVGGKVKSTSNSYDSASKLCCRASCGNCTRTHYRRDISSTTDLWRTSAPLPTTRRTEPLQFSDRHSLHRKSYIRRWIQMTARELSHILCNAKKRERKCLD